MLQIDLFAINGNCEIGPIAIGSGIKKKNELSHVDMSPPILDVQYWGDISY